MIRTQFGINDNIIEHIKLTKENRKGQAYTILG